jgi:hypothetical protein
MDDIEVNFEEVRKRKMQLSFLTETAARVRVK